MNLLKNYAANINARNADGNTPLHIACQHGNEDAVLALLDYTPDVNIKNFEGLTALGEARMNNLVNIVQLIEDRYKEDVEDTFLEPAKLAQHIDWERRRDPETNKVRSSSHVPGSFSANRHLSERFTFLFTPEQVFYVHKITNERKDVDDMDQVSEVTGPVLARCVARVHAEKWMGMFPRRWRLRRCVTFVFSGFRHCHRVQKSAHEARAGAATRHHRWDGRLQGIPRERETIPK